jgi:putative transposase
MIKLPRSSYYYTAQPKTAVPQRLITRMEEIIEEFPGYGYRRVTRQLQREGLRINHKKVLRIMQNRGLTRKPKRRWVQTTDSNHSCKIYPNLLQNRLLTAINQVWVADITYISIMTAFVYLAVILDLFSRKAIGYGIAQTLETSLCLSALKMALATRNPPREVIHHSDRGVQYAAQEYVDTLRSYHFQISMARKGNPYDNAAAESFMKTLKAEEVYLWEYRSLADVQKRLPYFIEQVYNRKRLHSSLGYRPPDEFEELFLLHQYSQPSCLTT